MKGWQRLLVLRGAWRRLRLTWRLVRDPRVPWHLKLIPAAGLAYVLWPLDLIADLATVLGVADDVAVALLAVSLFLELVPRPLRDHHAHTLE